MLERFWTPVGAGVKTEEEVDALALYLFGDSTEGREQARGIDETIAAVPGLERLRLLEDYLDGALARAAARPGWGGVQLSGPRAPRFPPPTHWREPARARGDAVAAAGASGL